MHKSISTKIIGLILLSAAVLTFEISLTRLFAVQQFHHFSFVVISLAVMGFAASGLLLSLRSKTTSPTVISICFSFSVGIALLTINYLPFDSYSIGFDPKQIWILLLYFAMTGLPFLFAGWVIGALLTESGEEAYRPYAANFIGSAFGSLLAILSISTLGGVSTILVSITLGICAAAAFSPRLWTTLSLGGISMIMLGGTLFFGPSLQIELSDYKPLSITRLFPDAKETISLESISAQLNLVETSSVHVFPGLSLNMSTDLPKQNALFIDGAGPFPLTSIAPEDPTIKNIASSMPGGIAHLLRPGADTLILQPGAGQDVLLALALGAEQVTMPTDEPLIVDIILGDYDAFSYGLLHHPRVSISPRTSRGILASAGQLYDIIQFSLTDSFRPVTSGAFSLTENYILTVEAIAQAYQHLSDDGVLIITRWLGTPPSESARAWVTVITALQDMGIDDPSINLIAFRSMRTGTILASPRAFTDTELDTIRNFLIQNSYDPIYLPNLQAEEANQYNRLPEDTYFPLFHDLLQMTTSTVDTYPFNLEPPRDDKPFFHHFFRWSQTPDVIAELGVRWQPFGGTGYLVLIILLGMMCLLALPMVSLPLAVLSKKSETKPGWAFTSFFASLGVGYLLIEIPLIQQFSLLLDRPGLAFAIVLFAMLLSSGIGSLFSGKLPLKLSLLLLSGYIALLAFVSPKIIATALSMSLPVRLALTTILIAPAGFLMGIPFASGLRMLARRARGTIPWAWAVNGAFSGISGVLAAMLTLDLGQRITILIGASFYLLAWASLRNLTRQD